MNIFIPTNQYANTLLFCFQVSLNYNTDRFTHTHTHIPQLNSTTVVVRSSLGSPLISPRLLCLLSRPALHAKPVFNMAAHPGSQSNNKLYLQLSAGLNHWDYCSTKSWIPLIFLLVKKVNRPKEINIAHPSTEISFTISFSSLANMARKSKRISLSFDECGQSQWNSFSAVGFLPQMYNQSFSKSLQLGCYLLSCEAPLLELTKPSNGAFRSRLMVGSEYAAASVGKMDSDTYVVYFPCGMGKKTRKQEKKNS